MCSSTAHGACAGGLNWFLSVLGQCSLLGGAAVAGTAWSSSRGSCQHTCPACGPPPSHGACRQGACASTWATSTLSSASSPQPSRCTAWRWTRCPRQIAARACACCATSQSPSSSWGSTRCACSRRCMAGAASCAASHVMRALQHGILLVASTRRWASHLPAAR